MISGFESQKENERPLLENNLHVDYSIDDVGITRKQCMGDHPGEWEANVQSHSHFSPEPRSNFVTRQVCSTIITVGIYP